ncbi:MAG: 3'(2'),5'-bisphosphate nucleotidase CysQ [Tissierellia bacterium]|nr:3'(2'),5'-bisphosphate nucleotidase CysQ [Tissierellia bacterium]
MNLERELYEAKNVAGKAGEAILKIYNSNNYEIEYKSDESPLTLADSTSNQIITEILLKEFPEYAMLTEESMDEKSRLQNDWCWIIDPLDGTKEFIKKNDEFTVNVALAYKGKPVLGVIYVPVTGILYYASKSKGAYKEENKQITKINVTRKTDDLIWVGSKSHASEKEQELIEANRGIISKIISAGSSLKGTMVAEGKADVYYRFGYTCEWDTCAMQCIVEEAGGIFKQRDHTEMTYNRENNLNEKGFYIVNRSENIWV